MATTTQREKELDDYVQDVIDGIEEGGHHIGQFEIGSIEYDSITKEYSKVGSAFSPSGGFGHKGGAIEEHEANKAINKLYWTIRSLGEQFDLGIEEVEVDASIGPDGELIERVEYESSVENEDGDPLLSGHVTYTDRRRGGADGLFFARPDRVHVYARFDTDDPEYLDAYETLNRAIDSVADDIRYLDEYD